ncbi:hypothetical protein BD408DRAFT_435099 [Parasitella parasitica]|nr:hypothetical protein BD408DRAFT_435099 [Parasitella parasitica]
MIRYTEIYGRTPEYDAHHEKIISTETQISPSSLPHIEVKIIQNENSCKLTLGFNTINALITSYVSIDIVSGPVLGPSSSNDFEPSPTTSIFISKQFINWYMSTTFDAGCIQMYAFDEFFPTAPSTTNNTTVAEAKEEEVVQTLPWLKRWFS